MVNPSSSLPPMSYRDFSHWKRVPENEQVNKRIWKLNHTTAWPQILRISFINVSAALRTSDDLSYPEVY
jgi:hypothetical protein